MLTLLQSASPPLFTNDLAGVIKALALVITGMSPVYGLTIWFLRRGPDQRIDAIAHDVDGIGTKVDEMSKEHAADRVKVGDMRVELGQSQTDRGQMNQRLAKAEAGQEALEKQIVGQQRDIMTAIQASSQAQMQAVFDVKLEVVKLHERGNIAAVLSERLERIAEIMVDRENRDMRDR